MTDEMWFGLLLLPLVCGVTVISGAVTATRSTRVWTVATGHDWGPHEYVDTEGYIQGFSMDLITLICAEAKMDCRIVWDNYFNCWKSEKGQRPHGGIGLMSRWYDACTGWVKTVERIHTFDFSQSYLKVQKAYFFTNPGASFNPRNLAGKKIGFFDGWSSNEQCVARADGILNNKLTEDQIVHVRGATHGLKMLKSDQIDALFSTENSFPAGEEDKLTKVDLAIRCALEGNSMMTRADSDFPAAWNVGFNKARSNGKFLAICEVAKSKHGEVGDVTCVDSY